MACPPPLSGGKGLGQAFPRPPPIPGGPLHPPLRPKPGTVPSGEEVGAGIGGSQGERGTTGTQRTYLAVATEGAGEPKVGWGARDLPSPRLSSPRKEGERDIASQNRPVCIQYCNFCVVEWESERALGGRGGPEVSEVWALKCLLLLSGRVCGFFAPPQPPNSHQTTPEEERALAPAVMADEEEAEVAAQLRALGLSGLSFRTLCARLVEELAARRALEEAALLSPGHEPGTEESFLLELSGLLRELHCPDPVLTAGEPAVCLRQPCTRLRLLRFLCSEVQAARLLRRKTPRVRSQEEGERLWKTREELTLICEALGMPSPQPGTAPSQLFQELLAKISELLPLLPPGHLAPLLTSSLDSARWV
ncbi:uncharacterized protein LOC119946211 [Tachyglossus aculeatus]|uniref:uncharacterized protein LOC119946211 n=1 Tax=Tachyglossus aculeatus TaxID=9261 RepID=UPI0018F359BE|nr:uncharacterized protein LOC119946211 [Tachyglossus aculeatus]